MRQDILQKEVYHQNEIAKHQNEIAKHQKQIDKLKTGMETLVEVHRDVFE